MMNYKDRSRLVRIVTEAKYLSVSSMLSGDSRLRFIQFFFKAARLATAQRADGIRYNFRPGVDGAT